MPIRTAIIGYGKIARDQHAPAIAADLRFELVAIASGHRDPAVDLPWFATAAELFEGMRGKLDAVAICTPPQVRHAIACQAIAASVSVLLEKPPAATLGEIDDLQQRSRHAGCGLYAAWHSQHAAAVPEAARLLEGEDIAALEVTWLEDVRKWHPGQEWIWSAGGFGVFDPGINALSILTRILSVPLLVQDARLLVPASRQAPIAATLTFAGPASRAEFDWRKEAGECWTIRIETAAGRTIVLDDGGASLIVDDAQQAVPERGEYNSIYDAFARVVEHRQVEVDREPLRIVADAFLIGSRAEVEPFA